MNFIINVIFLCAFNDLYCASFGVKKIYQLGTLENIAGTQFDQYLPACRLLGFKL